MFVLLSLCLTNLAPVYFVGRPPARLEAKAIVDAEPPKKKIRLVATSEAGDLAEYEEFGAERLRVAGRMRILQRQASHLQARFEELGARLGLVGGSEGESEEDFE